MRLASARVFSIDRCCRGT